MTQIIIQKLEGSVSIITPAPGYDIQKLIPETGDYLITDSDSLPAKKAADLEIDFETQEITVKAKDPTIQSKVIRDKRDAILSDTIDNIVSNPFRWNDFTNKQRDDIKKYRQALLDVPQQDGFPKVTWPKKPTFI